MARLEMSDEDFDEIRDVMEGVIDFVPDDREIMDALSYDPTLAGEGLSWGWGDSEVREALAEALEAVAEMQDD